MDNILLTDNRIRNVLPFWAESQETLIWSAIQGCMGTVWSDDLNSPTASRIIIGDFCFFAGEPNRRLVSRKPEDFPSTFIIMVPENEEWADLIERQYGDSCKRVTRYAIRKEPEIFSIPYLEKLVKKLNSKYQLKLIDQNIYNQTRQTPWMHDLCSQFKEYSAYKEHGLGVVITEDSIPVAGASSYTYYRSGIEIEIDTREDHRRQGLATVCGAALILECLKRGLYPSWDAQNKWSLSLAEKLGYHFSHEYTAYEVYDF